MYRKIRIRLTVFCTAITSIILILMAAICLIYVENQIKERTEAEFLRDVNAVLYYIRSQKILDHAWFEQMETESHLMIYLEWHGMPLAYTKVKQEEERDRLFSQIRKEALEEKQFDISEKPSGYYTDTRTVFSLHHTDGKTYYVAAAVVPMENDFFSVMIARDPGDEGEQIVNMRILFAFSAMVSSFCLFLFSFFFIKRVLQPVEESRKKQTEFIHAASHELKSPLAVIKTSLSLLPDAEAAQRDRICQMGREECGRMTRLLDDMLLIASQDAGNYVLHMEEWEAETLLLTSYERFEKIAADKGLRLTARPAKEPLPKIICDKERILQVLAILLDNALSYTPVGGVVEMYAEEAEGKVKISVSDTGPGIPKEFRQAVFERFYRRDASRTDRGHFGLGLSIAKELVERHQGRIMVKERTGGGSCFTIQLDATSG